MIGFRKRGKGIEVTWAASLTISSAGFAPGLNIMMIGVVGVDDEYAAAKFAGGGSVYLEMIDTKCKMKEK